MYDDDGTRHWTCAPAYGGDGQFNRDFRYIRREKHAPEGDICVSPTREDLVHPLCEKPRVFAVPDREDIGKDLSNSVRLADTRHAASRGIEESDQSSWPDRYDAICNASQHRGERRSASPERNIAQHRVRMAFFVFDRQNLCHNLLTWRNGISTRQSPAWFRNAPSCV